MSDPDQTYDVPQDTGPPDSVETDPAALNSAEDLDEDRLNEDPLEAGMDPPEHWSAADRRGMTPWEQAHQPPLDERLAQEEPEVAVAAGPAAPGDVNASVERPVPDATDETPPVGTNYHEDLGTSADIAGGSVADEIRTPPRAE